MRKLIIFIYMLLIPLSLVSCKEDKPKVPKSYYMEFETYENLKEYLNTYHNVDPFLPEFNVEGIIKYEYVLSGTCECLEATEDEAAHDGSHTFLCTNYVLENNYVYCYTEENKCFMIECKDDFIGEKVIHQNISKTTDYGDSYTAKITDSATIYFNAVDNSNNVDYTVSKNKGVFTKQEAVDWYTNVSETLEYDPLDDVDDKNDINIGPISRYMIMDNYEDYMQFAAASNEYAGDRHSDFLIPDYQFEGVIKKVYAVEAACWKRCCKQGDPICPTLIIEKCIIYCYTEENNGFVLYFNNGSLVNGEFEVINYPSLTNEYVSNYIKCKNTNKFNMNPGVSFLAHTLLYSKEDYKWDYVEDFNSEYTQEEAEYWYNIVYNTLKEYHS